MRADCLYLAGKRCTKAVISWQHRLLGTPDLDVNFRRDQNYVSMPPSYWLFLSRRTDVREVGVVFSVVFSVGFRFLSKHV